MWPSHPSKTTGVTINGVQQPVVATGRHSVVLQVLGQTVRNPPVRVAPLGLSFILVVGTSMNHVGQAVVYMSVHVNAEVEYPCLSGGDVICLV